MSTPTAIPGSDLKDRVDGPAGVYLLAQQDQGDAASSPGEATLKTVLVTTEGSPIVSHPGILGESPEIVVTEPGSEPQKDKNNIMEHVQCSPWSDNDDIIGDNPVVMPMPMHVHEEECPSRRREQQHKVTSHNLFLAADFDDVLGPSDELLGYRSWHQSTSMENLNEVEQEEEAPPERPRLRSSISAPQLKVQTDLSFVPSILDQMKYELPAQVSKNAAQTVSCHVEYKLDSVNFDHDISSTESQNAIVVKPSTLSKGTLTELDTKDSEAVPDPGNGKSVSKYTPSTYGDTKSDSGEERGSSSEQDVEFQAVDFELDTDYRNKTNKSKTNELNQKQHSENDRTYTESSSFEKESENESRGDETPNRLNDELFNFDDDDFPVQRRNTVIENADYKVPYSEVPPRDVSNSNNFNITNGELDSTIVKEEHGDEEAHDSDHVPTEQESDNYGFNPSFETNYEVNADDHDGKDNICHIPTLTELESNNYGSPPKAETNHTVDDHYTDNGELCHVPTLTELVSDDDHAVFEAYTSNDMLSRRRWSEDDHYDLESRDSKDAGVVPKPPPGRSGRGCVSAR